MLQIQCIKPKMINELFSLFFFLLLLFIIIITSYLKYRFLLCFDLLLSFHFFIFFFIFIFYIKINLLLSFLLHIFLLLFFNLFWFLFFRALISLHLLIIRIQYNLNVFSLQQALHSIQVLIEHNVIECREVLNSFLIQCSQCLHIRQW